MVLFREAVLAHVFVIAFGFKIRRIAVEKLTGRSYCPMSFSKSLVFHDHLGKPPVSLLNEGKLLRISWGWLP